MDSSWDIDALCAALAAAATDPSQWTAALDRVVDTVGAGDAFLAVTAPCASLDCGPDLLGFVGNAVGALAVRIVGNKESVEPTELYKFITTLLK